MSAPDWNPTVGDGATVCHYSDRTACTVIRISASGKTVWMQEDTAVLDDWKPEFIPGGFAGRFGWFSGNGNSKGANGDEFFERQWWSADDLDALVDLYHRLNWIRLRHLRIADAAVDYQAGDLGAQRAAD
jgi:hypothetical protein